MVRKCVRVLLFLSLRDSVMPEIRTQQTRQVLQALLNAFIYKKKEERVAEMVKSLFCDRNVSITLINGSHFIQLMFELNQKTCSTIFHIMKVSTNFKAVLFVHGTLDSHFEVKAKAMVVPKSAKKAL